MRAVIQRISQAQVEIAGKVISSIGPGLLVYLGVGKDDQIADARFIAEKIVQLRIFPDAVDKMNRSVQDIGGAILLVSQFTLYGDCRKGRRPGFDQSCPPEPAKILYEKTAELIRQQGVNCATGEFAAHMHITSVNDGPVTFLLDSSRLF